MSTAVNALSPDNFTGASLIAGQSVRGTGDTVRAHDPVANTPLEPAFPDSSIEDVDAACEAAAACFDAFRSVPREQRATLLEAIGSEILQLGDALLQRTAAETGLPLARLEGERARTVGQLRMFADIVRSGKYLGLEHDTALPDRKPLPRPDLRLRQIGLGPVAVFGASNFPLAFSVAGGDAASALAAGCPIVVKAHPAHPGTSEMVGLAVQQAVQQCGLPAGCFSMLHGSRHEIGQALATHPAICAIAFTGSRRGGHALMQLASTRPVPVPVYAEMSSVNPVFLLPAALQARGKAIAQGYADSLTLGTGQFCTQPGLVFALKGNATDAWISAATDALRAKDATPMLSPGIWAAYQKGVEQVRQHAQVQLAARGQSPSDNALRGQAALFITGFRNFVNSPELADEIFGPSSLVVQCESESDLIRAAETLEGQLTATLHIEEPDYRLAAQLVPVLERKAGRILVNGFPTGVEVGYAMSHGGPYPASSDGRSTSVGAHAVDRFLRPLCYQNFPQELLPDDLRSI